MGVSRNELRAYLRDELSVDTDNFKDTDLLFSNGFLDSFAVADLLVFLEEVGGFVVEPEEVVLENLDSIEWILDLVERKNSKTVLDT